MGGVSALGDVCKGWLCKVGCSPEGIMAEGVVRCGEGEVRCGVVC